MQQSAGLPTIQRPGASTSTSAMTSTSSRMQHAAHLGVKGAYHAPPPPAARVPGLSEVDAIFKRLQPAFDDAGVKKFPVQRVVTIVDSAHLGQDGLVWLAEPATPTNGHRAVVKVMCDICSFDEWRLLVQLVEECKTKTASTTLGARATCTAFSNKLDNIRARIIAHAAYEAKKPETNQEDDVPMDTPAPTKKSAQKAAHCAKGSLADEAKEMVSDALAYASALQEENEQLEQALETVQAKNAQLQAKNVQLGAKNVQLGAKNAQLDAKNVQLEAELVTSQHKLDKVSRRFEEVVHACQLGDDVMDLDLSMCFI